MRPTRTRPLRARAALVGARRHDAGGTDTGSAYIFSRDGAGTWTQEARIVAADAAAGDLFGVAVALSSSGDAALAGARSDDTEAAPN